MPRNAEATHKHTRPADAEAVFTVEINSPTGSKGAAQCLSRATMRGWCMDLYILAPVLVYRGPWVVYQVVTKECASCEIL